MSIEDAHELIGVEPGTPKGEILREFARVRGQLAQLQPPLRSTRELRKNRENIHRLDRALEVVLRERELSGEVAWEGEEKETAADRVLRRVTRSPLPGGEWWKPQISAEFLGHVSPDQNPRPPAG